jgi:S-adenosylmethionine:tRNA ribosyltransferase-isomerase
MMVLMKNLEKIDRTWRNPIPKYIRDVTPEDAATKIYAKEEGAVGRHCRIALSKHLLKKLEIKGIKFAEVTLHVGLGTFNPVEVEDLCTKWTLRN